jgi:hypothetical protein
MNLTLGVIIDGLAAFKPVVHKMRSTKVEFKQFYYYNTEISEINPSYLYVLNSLFFRENFPRHIIVVADTLPQALLDQMETVDTLIQIPGGISVSVLIQAGYELFYSYETWYQALLLAVIQHKPIGSFLEIAAEKLINPLALFDNNLAVISTAGRFVQSSKGTIWEKINDPNFVSTDFFNLRERRELSIRALKKDGLPYTYHPLADPSHTYVSSSIWINEKLYGSIGMVDINAPFTDGQISVIRQILQVLKWYFQNHSIYMQIMENKVNYIDNLLKREDISTEIVSRYLEKIKWKLGDNFCFLTLRCPVDLSLHFESISYIKQISVLFPKAMVSVYQDSIIMIVRCIDYPLRHEREIQQLEKLLRKNNMYCGISMVFHNFMYLRYYYVQSRFAAAQCKSHSDNLICYYENCQLDHVLQSLGAIADPQSFCHPEIIDLWESGDERQRELIHSLYYYLLNGKNITLTTKDLCIHRNTLIYRIEKLSNILHNDLKTLDPEQTFFYLFSCIIVRQGLTLCTQEKTKILDTT